MVKNARQPVADSHPARQAGELVSEEVSASLDLYRDLRDATSEAMFFAVYGNIFTFHMADRHEAEEQAAAMEDPRDLPWVREALMNIDKGGYHAAIARTAVLVKREGIPIPLSRIELKDAFIERNADLLPDMPWNEWRLIRGRQDLIVKFEPERALEAMATLLSDEGDRTRYLTLLGRLTSDPDFPGLEKEQTEMLGRILKVLGEPPGRPAPVKKRARRTTKTSA
jgi:hypothetical protein